MVLATASRSGCGSFAISAAISSVSEVDESFTSSPSRSSEALTRLPLWPTRDRARGAVLDDRLRVHPLDAAGRRVAGVADRELPVEPADVLLAEDLRDEAEVAEDGETAVVRDRDPGRLLAAVLERVQPEVGEARDVAVGSADAEHAAHQLPYAFPQLVEAEAEHRVAADDADRQQRHAAEPVEVLGRARDHGGRRSRRQLESSAPSPLQSAASASATARPPSETSCASESSGAARQRNSTSRASAPRSSGGGRVVRPGPTITTSPSRHRPGTARTSGTSPTQPTTGVGGIARPSVSL